MRRLKTVKIKVFKQDRGETPYFHLNALKMRLTCLKIVKVFSFACSKSVNEGKLISELKYNLM